MDPKQERALQEGSASDDDHPRDADRAVVRDEEEHRTVTQRPRPRRRTAALSDVRVNIESGTPVEQLARELGAEPVPEMGRARDRGTNGDPDGGRSQNGGRDDAAERRSTPTIGEQPRSDAAPAADATASAEEAAVPVKPGEARRTLKARREHSKGDGNFPRAEPGPELLDEKPEDRRPRGLPKARDDRSAPKGNVTVGQDDRDPDLAVREDLQARSPRTLSVAPGRTAEPKKTRPNAARRPSAAKTRKAAASTRAKATRLAGRAKATATRPPRRAKPTRKATKPAARKTARPTTRKVSRPARGSSTRSKRRTER